MHQEAWRWVQRTALGLARPPFRVLELGSRDVNGSVRNIFRAHGTLFPRYVGLDIAPGPGVDVVADAATWTPPAGEEPDCVVTTEMLEHVADAEAVIANVGRILKPGGVLLLTCATDPRAPHSAIDGGALHPGEHYRNVPARELQTWLARWAVRTIVDIYDERGDLYAFAVKAAPS